MQPHREKLQIMEFSTGVVDMRLQEQIHQTLHSFWETVYIGIIQEQDTKKCDEETHLLSIYLQKGLIK